MPYTIVEHGHEENIIILHFNNLLKPKKIWLD